MIDPPQFSPIATPELGTAALLARLTTSRSDHAAWTLLVERHGPRVMDLTWRILNDTQLAEDAAQETFLLMGHRAGQLKAHSPDPDQSATAWIHRIACRCALSIARRERRRRRSPLPSEDQIPSPEPDQDPSLNARIPTGALLSAIAELTVRQREMIALYQSGMSSSDMAQALGCTLTNARVRLHRSLKHLRTRLSRRGVSLSSTDLFTESAALPLVPSMSPSNVHQSVHNLVEWSRTSDAYHALTSVKKGFSVMATSCIAATVAAGILITCFSLNHGSASESTSTDPGISPHTLRGSDSGGGEDSTTVPRQVKPLLGCWKMVPDPTQIIKIGAHQAWSLADGRVTGCRISFDKPGILDLRGMGEAHYVVSGDRLTLSLVGSGESVESTRCAEPFEFHMQALPVPPPRPISDSLKESISTDIRQLRNKEDLMFHQPGADVNAVLKADTEDLSALITEHGWIDSARFGRDVSEQACRIAGLSGCPGLVLAAVQGAERDFKAGRLSAQSYAMIYDASQEIQALPQEYGTQVISDDKGKDIVYVHDPAQLNKRRAQIGLGPLSSSAGPEGQATVMDSP